MFESAVQPPRFKPSFSLRLPSFSLRGRRLFRGLLRLALIIVPLLFLRACVFTYVPPDRIGLRQISFGPSKGLQKQLVRPGYRRAISGYETIHTFPRNLQAIEFTNDESERGSDHRTFAVDLALTERLRPLIPRERVVVAESGIKGRAEARRMREAGADAILAGEVLMRATDPAAVIGELRGA